MFPFEFRGEVRIRDLPDASALRDEAVKRIVDELAEVGARTSIADGAIRFTIHVSETENIFFSIDGGTVRVEAGRHTILVSYRFSTFRIAWGLAAVLLAFDIFLSWREPFDPRMVGLPLIGWVVFYGAGQVISKIQIYFWMKRILRDLGKSHP